MAHATNDQKSLWNKIPTWLKISIFSLFIISIPLYVILSSISEKQQQVVDQSNKIKMGGKLTINGKGCDEVINITDEELTSMVIGELVDFYDEELKIKRLDIETKKTLISESEKQQYIERIKSARDADLKTSNFYNSREYELGKSAELKRQNEECLILEARILKVLDSL